MADEKDDKENDPPVSSYLRRPRRTLQEAEKAIAVSGPEPISASTGPDFPETPPPIDSVS